MCQELVGWPLVPHARRHKPPRCPVLSLVFHILGCRQLWHCQAVCHGLKSLWRTAAVIGSQSSRRTQKAWGNEENYVFMTTQKEKKSWRCHWQTDDLRCKQFESAGQHCLSLLIGLQPLIWESVWWVSGIKHGMTWKFNLSKYYVFYQ